MTETGADMTNSEGKQMSDRADKNSLDVKCTSNYAARILHILQLSYPYRRFQFKVGGSSGASPARETHDPAGGSSDTRCRQTSVSGLCRNFSKINVQKYVTLPEHTIMYSLVTAMHFLRICYRLTEIVMMK